MLGPGQPGTPNQQQSGMSGGPLTPQQAMQMQPSPGGPPHGGMMNPSPGPQGGGPPGSNQGPGSSSGPAPMMPPGQAGQSANQPQAANTQQAAEMKFDHVFRVRSLVWQLKDSLANLMKIAANNLYKNSCIDIGTKSTEKVPRFDKALEEFVSICNQIELHLKTIQDCYIQARESNQCLPFPVNQGKTDAPTPADQPPNMPQDQSMSYSQYLNTIKNQVQFAKALREILLAGASKITDDTPPQMPQTMMPGTNLAGPGAPTSGAP